jgi:hypothetical protein
MIEASPLLHKGQCLPLRSGERAISDKQKDNHLRCEPQHRRYRAEAELPIVSFTSIMVAQACVSPLRSGPACRH